MINKVELIGVYGSDITHAQSAWTSTHRELNEDKIERIPLLLKMLAENNHHTPFEKSSLHFLVTVDQATHIHLLKHRIGVSINGESARYKELKEDKMYLPVDWVNHENSIVRHWAKILKENADNCNRLYHECLADLTPALGRKRAKESARYLKLMNSQITMDVMFNWRSFAHFIMLRVHETAQSEVQLISKEMLELVKQLPDNPFEHTIKAFKL